MALTKITPQMFDTSAAGHDFNIDNGTFVVDASANRVGIGTATPSTLLDVNGTLTATTIVGTLTTTAQTNITSVGTLTGLTVSAPSGDTPASIVTTTAGSFLSISDGNTTSGRSPLVGAITDAMVFYTSAGSYTERMRIASTGNVGIGDAPSSFTNAALHVAKDMGNSVTAVARLRGRNTTARTTRLQFEDYAGAIADGLIDFHFPNAGSHTGAYFGMGYNTSTHLAINVNGYVGIGTTSPDRNLHIETAGDSYLRVSGNRGNANDLHVGNIEFENTFGSAGVIAEMRAITGNSGTQSTKGQLAFYTDDGSTYAERMRIDSSGDVLIGSTTNLNVLSGTPKLQIGSGTGHASLQFYSGTSSVNGIYFGDTSNANVDRYDGYIEYQHANRLISFRASGTNPLTIKSTGPLLPAGNFGYHTTQEHYTASTPASSYSSASNITYNSSTQYWPDQGEKQICVINARAYTNYIHIKTNLTANNIMFYFRTKGYFYAVGCEEQLIGGYTYTNNSVISKDNQTVAGNTHTGDTYRASDGSLVLKMHVNQIGYTEGKMLVFFHAHAPSTTSGLTVTHVTQKDDGTNAF